MIIASLKDIDMQIGCDSSIKIVIEFLKNNLNKEIPLGRFELGENDLFGYSQKYKTKEADEDLRYEAHKKYIDVQYIISGSEKMRWVNISDLNITNEYDAVGDCILGTYNDIDYREIKFNAGDVVIIYPEDAHATSIVDHTGCQNVCKLVIKVPYTK